MTEPIEEEIDFNENALCPECYGILGRTPSGLWKCENDHAWLQHELADPASYRPVPADWTWVPAPSELQTDLQDQLNMMVERMLKGQCPQCAHPIHEERKGMWVCDQCGAIYSQWLNGMEWTE